MRISDSSENVRINAADCAVYALKEYILKIITFTSSFYITTTV